MSQMFHHKLNFVLSILCFWWPSWNVLSQELISAPTYYPGAAVILNSSSNGKENNYRTSDTNSGSLYFFSQQPDYPRDCEEARRRCSVNKNGVHLIKPDGYPEPFEVFCDNAVDSGGWTVIKRVKDGSILFNRNWTEYKLGFGFPSQEFWLGNDKLSYLTNQESYELFIEFTSDDGLSFGVRYNSFRISDEYGDYKITSVGDYSGTEGNITSYLCPPGTNGMVLSIPGCSRRCTCNGGRLACDNSYQCSANAVCEERNNVLQCYCNEGYVGDGVNCTIEVLPSDCKEIFDRISTESGVYKIKPNTWQAEPFDVYCNMTDGGGWTVFQRRVDGSQDFFLYWSDYKLGFGTPDRELWLGNDKLHSLTTQRSYELRIDFVNSLGNPFYAKYNSFSIGDESDKYRLRRGSYSGNAGNSLDNNNGQGFTTRDRDNDIYGSGNCASDNLYHYFCSSDCSYQGGWWFRSCG